MASQSDCNPRLLGVQESPPPLPPGSVGLTGVGDAALVGVIVGVRVGGGVKLLNFIVAGSVGVCAQAGILLMIIKLRKITTKTGTVLEFIILTVRRISFFTIDYRLVKFSFLSILLLFFCCLITSYISFQIYLFFLIIKA
ncbi:hypothetical protein A3D78_03260 [Candidatus Gottesmanbacteria bacterium RIFCSPHIGHO2_02_FULL_39_14]|uniref:Uncharacterized protein n=2 Tax=Candidatus Gottesmaniibacteriota TaxID=1752720 RepID=A0A1F5ZXS7_9BACT|nr:MAG: hypothetical protein A3D78_03260 [Candidatus Gottesmanbacteria bacterium RIFCSPHIGHO2_02_FULL_39_14]OGG30837.1 MAG: hypothetical protein A3I51_03485 [Candidatus Gottesmanbacteria bacterium RIFCSPLOWO2_02_FULL_38_8]